MMEEMKGVTTATVRESSLDLEQPWRVPKTAERVPLTRSSDGSRPRLETECAIYRDDRNLYILFLAEDDEIVATHRHHDAPLYEEDVFEVFLAPETLTTYYEIEVNPLGTTFDARIVSPDGHRATMNADLEWECLGLWAAVQRTERRTEAIVVIPFAALDREPPRSGEIWRANLYRIDRSATHGDEYSAWSPTRRTPPDFHVPALFGALRFE